MSPKMKAIDLVEIYSGLCTYDKDGLVIPVAKVAANIAVDEMISENESVLEMLNTHGDDRSRLPVKFRIIWLKQVKEELTKL